MSRLSGALRRMRGRSPVTLATFASSNGKTVVINGAARWRKAQPAIPRHIPEDIQ